VERHRAVQFSTGGWGTWLVGAFADYDFMDLNGNEKESGAWAVGARIGYLVAPAILVYWNGGFTETRCKWDHHLRYVIVRNSIHSIAYF
jgi:hypothetical protein